MTYTPQTIAIIGASGGIGSAFVHLLSKHYPDTAIHAFSRKAVAFDADNAHSHPIDLTDEVSIQRAAEEAGQPDWVLVTAGLLHREGMMPEKALKELDAVHLQDYLAMNAVGPALVAKHFLPRMPAQEGSIFAAISARVGSVSDNRKGGWYGYRASKAALNMLLKCASIEMQRKSPWPVVVGLHPGTVDTGLSAPFQKYVPDEQLFSPQQAVEYLHTVLQKISAEDSGGCFAWDGERIEP